MKSNFDEEEKFGEHDSFRGLKAVDINSLELHDHE